MVNNLSNWKEFREWFVDNSMKPTLLCKQIKENNTFKQLFLEMLNNDCNLDQDILMRTLIQVISPHGLSAVIAQVAKRFFNFEDAHHLLASFLESLDKGELFRFASLFNSVNSSHLKDDQFWNAIAESLLKLGFKACDQGFFSVIRCARPLIQEKLFEALFKIDEDKFLVKFFIRTKGYNAGNLLELALLENQPELCDKIVIIYKKDCHLKSRLFNSHDLNNFVVKNNYQAVRGLLQICFSDRELLSLLLDNRKEQHTVIYTLISRNFADLVELLLQNCSGNPPLMKLLLKPDKGGGNVLIHALNTFADTKIASALLKAVENDFELLSLLLQKDLLGDTPLLFAYRNMQLDIVDQLLMIASRNRLIMPLLFAANNFRINILNLSARTNDIQTFERVLDLIAVQRDLKELLFQPTVEGNTVLHHASKYFNILEALIAACGVDTDFKRLLFRLNDFGWSPLDYAVDRNSTKCVLLLLEVAEDIQFPFEVLLKDPDVCLYLFVNHPQLMQSRLDKRGGYETLSYQEKLSILPFFKPAQIAKISESLTEDLLDETLNTEGGTLQIREYFNLLIESLSTNDEDSFREMVKNLPLKFKHFAVHAKFYPDLHTPLIKHLSEAQLACSVPVLNPEQLTPFVRSTKILSFTTLVQKKELIEKSVATFSKVSEWSLGEWEKLIADKSPLKQELMQKFGRLSQLIRTGESEINQLKEAFCRHEDTHFQQTIEEKFDPYYLQFKAALEGVDKIRVQLEAIYKESQEDSRFTDPFTEELMNIPIKLPQTNNWVDLQTLKHLSKNSDGWIKHPFLYDTYFPPEEYVVDTDLQNEIAAWNDAQENKENLRGD